LYDLAILIVLVFARGEARNLFEHPGEMCLIGEAKFVCDIGQRIIATLYGHHGAVDLKVQIELVGRDAQRILKQMGEMKGAEIEQAGKLGQPDVLFYGGVNIFNDRGEL